MEYMNNLYEIYYMKYIQITTSLLMKDVTNTSRNADVRNPADSLPSRTLITGETTKKKISP